ncbi:MAG: GTPase EngC, partial [Acidimicrobiia bacterium]|nr:GTPase EngC [Acidimicrobiia bacterium]
MRAGKRRGGRTIHALRFPSLIPYGWSDRWETLFADVASPDAVPARVLRHDSVSVAAAGPDGMVTAVLSSQVGSIAVGDWVGVTDEVVTCLLPRTSLLRRRAAITDEEQALAANVDIVLLVCGLDRPLKAGRIQRASALAWDAGARPVLVLSKADLAPNTDLSQIEAENPGLDVIMISSRLGEGLDRLRETTKDCTVVLMGESGSGKSTLDNDLVVTDVSSTGA